MKNLTIILFLFIFSQSFSQIKELTKTAEEGYVNNNGVRIHYLEWGEGPLMVMLHGFPDFWYSWRHLIPVFSKNYKVVAIDLRGYNLSDKPEGIESYAMKELRGDVLAVIDFFKAEGAILVANDWGGAIAWSVALNNPERVDKLVACNIPFPSNIGKYISEHPEVGQYARDFQAHETSDLTPESMFEFIPDKKEKENYLEAFRKSNIESMLNYYKASYPASNNSSSTITAKSSITFLPNVQCPVLMIYGLQDKALPPGMLNNSWDRLDNNLTIYTIPDGGHFIQQEKPDIVIRVIKAWLSIYE